MGGRERIVLSGEGWLIECSYGYKMAVNTPSITKRDGKALVKLPGVRREYQVYVRDLINGGESYLDGGIARSFMSLIEEELGQLLREEALVVLPGGVVPIQQIKRAITQLRFE